MPFSHLASVVGSIPNQCAIFLWVSPRHLQINIDKILSDARLRCAGLEKEQTCPGESLRSVHRSGLQFFGLRPILGLPTPARIGRRTFSLRITSAPMVR